MEKKPVQKIERVNREIDAAGKSVGRVATAVAMILRGKTKTSFAPHLDVGDVVTVINASQVIFTGKKLVQKDYRKHTMHPGGLKVVSMKKVFTTDPTSAMRRAVYGMLPKNKHRDQFMKRLTIRP